MIILIYFKIINDIRILSLYSEFFLALSSIQAI